METGTLLQLVASGVLPWKESEVITKTPIAWLIADAFPVTPNRTSQTYSSLHHTMPGDCLAHGR